MQTGQRYETEESPSTTNSSQEKAIKIRWGHALPSQTNLHGDCLVSPRTQMLPTFGFACLCASFF